MGRYYFVTNDTRAFALKCEHIEIYYLKHEVQNRITAEGRGILRPHFIDYILM